jgi:hypothetical protein
MLGLILIAAIGASGWMWNRFSDAPMTIHGWIALALGVSVTFGLGVGLMALTFHSARSGHDEAVAQADPTAQSHRDADRG